MLKKTLKWAIMPVVAIGMMVSLNSFTETGGEHTHALCITGTSKHCSTRECTTAGCPYRTNVCTTAAKGEAKDCKGDN